MPAVHREVERKYLAEDDAPLPSPARLVAQAGVLPDPGSTLTESEETALLEAVYHDTEDLRLAAAGLSVRRRTGGHDAGWHLKVPDGTGARSEIAFPLGEPGAGVPESLAAMVRAVTRGAPLGPVAEVTTQRRAVRLVDATGRELVEVADDRVTARRVRATGGSGDARGAAQTWREVEVELVDGDESLLDALDAGLRAAGLHPAEPPSKVGRVLGPRPSRPGRVRLGPRSPAGDVVRAHLAEHVAQVVAQDLPVRLDAPEAVHRMRVATRRLRGALGTFGPLLDRDEVRPLRDELRWLAGVLGEVRDAQVFRDRVRAAADGAVAPDGAAALADAAAGVDEERREAQERLLAALDGDRYRDLLRGLDALAEDPPLTPRARRSARRALPPLVARRDREVRTAVRRARAADAGPGRDALLHEARKAAKAARYAGEAVRPALGKPAKRYARALEAVQEVLGEHQDSVVARERLHELARHASGEAAFRLGLLHAAEARRGRRAERALRASWARARDGDLRRWLR
jgi:CHAD domain-containing protein